MIKLQAPTGMLLDLVLNLNVKLPLTPAPLAPLQICRRPVGAGVGVGVQFGAQLEVGVGVRVGLSVAVGVPAKLFVKIASVTPLPTLTITMPTDVSLLTVREPGFTSIAET
jgi:hypothetical protein